MSAIEVIALRKTFDTVTALDGADLAIERDTIHGIIGPNGSGKTTLINCITGLLRPDGGRIVIGGADIDGWRGHRIAKHGVRRSFQHGRLVPDLTVHENVLSGLYAGGESELERERLAVEASALTGVDALRDRPAKLLVWAERQRVQLARAIAASPKILLLDEPTAGLGPTESEEISDVVRTVRERGTTVVVVSHDVRLLLALSDRVTVLDNGRVVATETPAKIRRSDAVKEAYLGSA